MYANSAYLVAQPTIFYGQHQQQAPSWSDIVPSTSSTTLPVQDQHNDIFSGMGTFDAANVDWSSGSCGSSSSSSSSSGESPEPRGTFQPYQQPAQYTQHYPAQFCENQVAQYAAPVYQCQVAQYPDQYYQPAQVVQKLRKPAQLVEHLTVPFEELYQNGYPVMGGNGRVALADTKYVKQCEIWVEESQSMRMCCRCNTLYCSTGNGSGTGLCRYHPKGKLFDQDRGILVRECCGEEFGLTEGCKVNNYHVTSQMPQSELAKFMETEDASGYHDKRNNRVYALDCEMVYTVDGPALARLTVIGWNEKPVLDCLVRPPTRVIDTNEEFSGIKMEDLERATDTLETCRERLLKLVNGNTILVGHSLESDLKALRLIHYNVVDTALLFKSGDYKVGLKKLALQHLGLAIQSNNNEQFGHDSEEDARVSLQLLKYKMCTDYY